MSWFASFKLPDSSGSWPGLCFEVCDVIMTSFLFKNKVLFFQWENCPVFLEGE